LFEIPERGFIREGYWADLVVCRPTEEPVPVSNSPLYSQCQWSPFDGEAFHSVVEHTLISGQRVASHGKILSEPEGQPLTFNR